ncbi:MAG: hypothetical protein JWN81_1317 [Solirubrobacterales bacterium]|nr:hypothetical protein [Solirubrobacterales bacterium]
MVTDQPQGKGRAKQAAAMCFALLAAVTVAARAAPAGAATATWMGGPGCGGRIEWRQHPAAFPYFCDGAAVIEHVRWRN